MPSNSDGDKYLHAKWREVDRCRCDGTHPLPLARASVQRAQIILMAADGKQDLEIVLTVVLVGSAASAAAPAAWSSQYVFGILERKPEFPF